MSVFIVSCGLIVLLLWLYLEVQKRNRWADPIPGPPSDIPFLGNLIRFGHYDYFSKLSQKYGGIFKVYFHTNPIVVVTDPTTVQDVLLRDNRDFYKETVSREVVGPLIGKALVFSDGDVWKEQRKSLNHCFSQKNLANMLPCIISNSKIFLKRLDDAKGAVNTQELFRELTLDIVGSIAFGYQVNAQSSNSPVGRAFNTFEREVNNRIYSVVFPFLRYVLFWQHWRFVEAVRVLEEEADKIIDNRVKYLQANPDGADDRGDILSSILASEENHPKEWVRQQVLTFLLAGHGTTSTLLTWMCYMFAMHPQVKEKARREVLDVLKDVDIDQVTIHDLEKLKYLQMVLQETLRVYPLPYTMRETTCDTEIGGYKVPKGAKVAIGFHALHNDPKIWTNPHVFDPERFRTYDSENSAKGMDPFTYAPFNRGPRNCIGQRLAQLEAKIVMVQILRNFDFTVANTKKVSPKIEIALVPDSRIMMNFKRISAN